MAPRPREPVADCHKQSGGQTQQVADLDPRVVVPKEHQIEPHWRERDDGDRHQNQGGGTEGGPGRYQRERGHYRILYKGGRSNAEILFEYARLTDKEHHPQYKGAERSPKPDEAGRSQKGTTDEGLTMPPSFG
jgi:hypothetical protein